MSPKPTRAPMSRSAVMARVRSKNSRPEMLVRRTVYALGYRYRLHCKGLPGTPDMVFRSRGKVIFIHGCFWHAHDCKLGNRRPKTRTEFWNAKIERNIERDSEAMHDLTAQGWDVLVVSECELGDADGLRRRIETFLGPHNAARRDAIAMHAEGGMRDNGQANQGEAG